MDEIEGTKGVINHCYYVVFLKNRSSVDRVEYLFEVRLNVFDDHKNLLEVLGIYMFVIVKLLFYYLIARHRWSPSIGLISGPHVHLCHVIPWRDDIIQLSCEDIVFHESELSENLDLAQYFPCRILVVKCITDLLDGNFFLRRSVLSFDHSSETAFATDF